MNRINWGEPACSEKSVCRTSREVRKANDTQEVGRPRSTCEAWNLAKNLHSRGIAWDNVWREGEEGDYLRIVCRT